MIILNEEQASFLVGMFLCCYKPGKQADELKILETLKGNDLDNRNAYRKEIVTADVHSILEGNYYDSYKKLYPSAVFQAVNETIEHMLNSYDHSDYNEYIDYVLSDKIDNLLPNKTEANK